MIEVYAVPVSLYCAKLRIVLRHKALIWQELPPPGGYGSDEYAALVPSGNLPSLRENGLLLSDSEAIAEYLNEAHPLPPMLPETLARRAQARERGRFHDTRLEPALRAMFAQIAPTQRNIDKLAEGGAALSRHLAVLARLLDQAPLPGGLWLGDCGFAISLEWIAALEQAIGLPVIWPDRVRVYRHDLRQHPAVATELQSYLPHIVAYLQRAA